MDRKTTLKAAIEKAAAQYKVKSSTLISTFYRNSPKGPQHGNRFFNDKEEDVFVWALQGFSHNNMAVTLPLFYSVAYGIFGVRPYKMWSRKFFARHRNALKPNATKRLYAARNKDELLIEMVNDFLKQLETFLKDRSFPPCTVMNYDETILSTNGKKLVLTRINSKNRNRANSELKTIPPRLYDNFYSSKWVGFYVCLYFEGKL